MFEVAITGIGIISVLGNTPDAVSAALYQGQSGIICDPHRKALGFVSSLTGALDFDGTQYLTRKQRKTMTEHALYAWAAVEDALKMADLQAEDWQNDQTGVLFGCDSSCLAGPEQVEKVREFGDTRLIGSGAIFRSMTSNVTMNLSTILGTRGACWTVSGACASGSHAVGQAYTLIRTGQQDRVICGGAQEINWQSICSFDGLGAFASDEGSPEKACRPFDVHRTGLVPSGGAAALVLERYDSAKKRNVPVLGRITGYGFSSDGAHIAEPDGDGLYRAARAALNSADITPDRLDYICAHATATPRGDEAEARCLQKLCAGHSPVISSLKGMTGHELWMSGASQLVCCTLMARDGFIAPNINLETPDPSARGLNITPVVIERAPRTVLCNAAGFGGTNASLVVQY